MAHLIFRKTWRLFGLIFPLIYIFNPKEITLIYTSGALAIFLFIELFRLSNSDFNCWLFKRFGFILKEEERRRALTTTTFLISTLLVIIFFKKEVAIYSLLFLILGDSASALIGKNFGRIKIKDKSLEGSLAFIIICLLTGIFLLDKIRLAFPVILIGALTGALVELLPLPLDDNFTIGLSCGIVMEIILKIL